MTEFQPRLIVDDGDAAIDFYRRALGAELLSRHDDDSGKVANAELVVDGSPFSLTEAGGDLNRSPSMLHGSPVIISVTVADVDDVVGRFIGAGGRVVIGLDDRPYGRRDGRFADPSGHLWIFASPFT